MTEKCPTEFYRYRSLSSGASEYVERTICHNELYFAPPRSFNDPFDCRPCFSFEGTAREMDSYYQRLYRGHLPELNRAERRKEARSTRRDKGRNPTGLEAELRMQELHTEEITNNIGVLCLSANRDDILMWSHYADSHRGICLEFDGYYEFFANALEVQYQPSRPTINPFKQTRTEMMNAALLSKSEHWKYEEEWRAIQYNGGPGVYRFPPKALTGIILGAQISEPDRAKLHGWVTQRTDSLRLYQSTPSKTTFSLHVEEIDLGALLL
ncbi:DUF2971 domain-containing protein [Massilia psychrophila]|uniref:DUF2971 domain-containing protein n=1 Tax=Massilia psychrophila TaxID=1603353 RepID=A0A2G8SZJ8_9BURK|nr:DUF2971 domain-containing protein [Massilia psychrophila]PIL39194.1 hypothetical protein CR103_13990 [Massilia psychrophila]GGE82152.1 hypothetical protein GCM10008020_28850 [Massilia psychrophila]